MLGEGFFVFIEIKKESQKVRKKDGWRRKTRDEGRKGKEREKWVNREEQK